MSDFGFLLRVILRSAATKNLFLLLPQCAKLIFVISSATARSSFQRRPRKISRLWLEMTVRPSACGVQLLNQQILRFALDDSLRPNEFKNVWSPPIATTNYKSAWRC